LWPNGSGKPSINYKILKYKWLDWSTYINPDAIASMGIIYGNFFEIQK
jgi:predicted ABC-type ATPase